MSFKELGVSAPIIKSIEELGFKSPTEVQKESIPPILAGKDLIVMAKTGSGKTGAFGIPIIQGVNEDDKFAQALIITPTRELAVQVDKDIQSMAKHTQISSMAVYGQHNMNVEVADFKKGRQIVVGTPGRVFHHIQNKTLNTKRIKFLVLDEADRMLDMGFIDQMIKIIKSLSKERVTLLFSATMPAEVQRICKAYMKTPDTIELESDTKTVDSIKQYYFRVEKNDKRNQLCRILFKEQPKSCMIFCNTRIEVDKVSQFLTRRGFVSDALHGANTQNRRMRTIAEFKNGDIQLLVATDVAARGIHIDDLSLVINYDLPVEKDSYIHRIGRTGRAGNGGRAMALVTSDDIYTLYEIEEHVGAMIEEIDLPEDGEVAEGSTKTLEIWAEKRETRKKVHVQREKNAENRASHSKNNHNKRSQSDHFKSGHKKPTTLKKPLHDTAKKPHHDAAKKPHHDSIAKKVYHKSAPHQDNVHQKTPVVRKLITEDFTPVVNKVIHKKTVEKKKFSLKNLFSKKKNK